MNDAGGEMSRSRAESHLQERASRDTAMTVNNTTDDHHPQITTCLYRRDQPRQMSMANDDVVTNREGDDDGVDEHAYSTNQLLDAQIGQFDTVEKLGP